MGKRDRTFEDNMCKPHLEAEDHSNAQLHETRTDRLEIRLTPKEKSILKRAALVEHKTVSAFIRDKGLSAAAETLADRPAFSLSAKQYHAFVAALDAPRKFRPRLEKLLRTPGVLE
jgi:uncharacterized protein (DUF1778 family)